MASDAAASSSGPPGETNPDFVYLDSNFYLDYLIGDRPYGNALNSTIEAWAQRGASCGHVGSHPY